MKVRLNDDNHTSVNHVYIVARCLCTGRMVVMKALNQRQTQNLDQMLDQWLVTVPADLNNYIRGLINSGHDTHQIARLMHFKFSEYLEMVHGISVIRTRFQGQE